jgi:hypothetical protein
MGERNYGCRVSTDYTYKGYRLAVLENECLRVSVLLDKGADIIEFQHKPSGTDFLWWTPWGLHEQGKLTPSSALPEGFFGDLYQGTWQEIFPNGGAASRHQKVDYGLHGEASLQPWKARILKDRPAEVCLEVSVETYRSPFRLLRRMTLRSGVSALFLDESVTNLSGQRVDAMWGHHPALGAPFLNPHCRIDLPGAHVVFEDRRNPYQRFAPGTEGVWPKLKGKDGKMVDLSRFPDPRKPSADMFYLTRLKQGWYGITDTKKKVGFGLAWDQRVWPTLWFWQLYGGGRDAPFWGRTYNCALEPFAGWPGGLANAAANGSALRFGPHQTRRAWLTAVAYSGRKRVSGIGRDGSVR